MQKPEKSLKQWRLFLRENNLLIIQMANPQNFSADFILSFAFLLGSFTNHSVSKPP